MDILEQIGITKEELIERIADRALGIAADYRQTGEESWSDIPLSDVVDKKIRASIDKLMDGLQGRITERVDQIMVQKMEEVFTAPFQRTDRWGDKIGNPTTIREMIADQAAAYWNVSVDSSGKPTSYNGTERAKWYASQVMEGFYKSELQREVVAMADAMKKAIPATIAKEISDTVLKYLK